MVNYNLTNLTTVDGLGDLVTFANEVTRQHFTGFMLLALFIIMLMALKRYGFSQALLASSWAAFLLSLLLTFGDLMNPIYTFGFLAVAAFTALYSVAVGE